MNLQQFKSWKLLYEDQELCFSRAVHINDTVNVFFITFFKPEKLAIATKHMIQEHLNNYMALIDDDGKLHLVLREQVGHPIKKFISKSALTYDDRIQVAYSYLKQISKYDVFPDAVKIQLVDDEQCLINDDGVSFRELVDYTISLKVTLKDVLKQVGLTLDIILHDAGGYQSQFIDNLIIGNQPFDSLTSLKSSFKDVFIYEKPEALETIISEYTIILNDLEAGPPLKLPNSAPLIKPQLDPVIHHDDLHEELQRELAQLLNTSEDNRFKLNTIEIDVDEHDIDEDDSDEDDIQDEDDIEDDYDDDELEEDVEDDLDYEDEDQVEELPLILDPVIEPETTQTKSFKAIFDEEDKLPESLPKSSKQRYLDDETDLFDDDMSQMFDEDHILERERKTFPKWLLMSVAVILVAVLSFVGFSQFFSSEPVSAAFVIEPLREERVAFLNTSTGEKNIVAYAWEVYYADTLVQTFTDENLFPVFDTDGEYKIVLKVKDKDGNWSEPYSEIYVFTMKEE